MAHKKKSGKAGRIAGGLVKTALAGGLIYGGVEVADVLTEPDPATLIHSDDKVLVEKTAKASFDFWGKHGADKNLVTKASVVVVEGGHEYDFHCGDKVTPSYATEIGSCATKDGFTVVIPARAINDLRQRNTEREGNVAIQGWVRIGAAAVRQTAELTQHAPTDSKERYNYNKYQEGCLGGIESATILAGKKNTDTAIIYQSVMHSADEDNPYEGTVDHRAVAINYKNGYEAWANATLQLGKPAQVNANLCADPFMGD